MKNRFLNIALFSLMIACAACNKISEEIQQDIVIIDTVLFEIPILDTDNSSATIPNIPLSFDLEEQVKNAVNNYNINQIKGTKIKSLTLGLAPIRDIITNKNSIDIKNNFSNLASIRFRIAASGKFGNLASTPAPLNGTISLTGLNPTIVPDSLKTFMLNPASTYEVTVKAKKATTTKMIIGATAIYTITLAK